MKAKKIELDVDFIGGQGALSAAEEKALSDFFQQRKMTNKTAITIKKVRKIKKKPVTA